ncbi:hypothetical protein T484DRAFT_2023287 [Baffinella frigidus]|nr:hypothetical protein T484DRAFT_2023287 [Cryptophyta sp. CCMP2293]
MESALQALIAPVAKALGDSDAALDLEEGGHHNARMDDQAEAGADGEGFGGGETPPQDGAEEVEEEGAHPGADAQRQPGARGRVVMRSAPQPDFAEDDGPDCRICKAGEEDGRLIRVCRCRGSLQYAPSPSPPAALPPPPTTCSLCAPRL